MVGFGHLDVPAAEVNAVYVHPDHARQGVGTALLAGLEGYARGVGLDALELSASLNAIGFDERAGYERPERGTHETAAGVGMDCVEMGKRL